MSSGASPNARFLSLVLPFEQADGKTCFNLHWAAPKRNGDGKFWSGRAAFTLNEFLNNVSYWGGKNYDTYICMSSQRTYDEAISNTKKTYKKARRHRADFVGIKSFVLDIDVKDKGYKTTEEAVAALGNFCAALDLPDPSAVVLSGSGGLHVYWACERPLTIEEWKPVANALAHASLKLGLKCDTQCTVDSIRILRMPGTLNHKTKTPTKVEFHSLGEHVEYEDLKSCLSEFIGLTPLGKPDNTLLDLPKLKALDGISDLSAGIDNEASEFSIQQLTATCPVIRDAVAQGGANYEEPLWRMTLSAAAFTTEGRAAAHTMSEKHAGYSKAATDDKYDQVVNAQRENNLGWPTCNKFQLSGASQCATCPLLANKKTPFHFVFEEDEPEHKNAFTPSSQGMKTDWIMPEGYSRRADGKIYKSIGDDTGSVIEVKISDYMFVDGWLQSSPWVLHFSTVTSVGKRTKIEIPFDAFSGMGGASKEFGLSGMALSDNEYKAVKDFCVNWIKRLQLEKEAVVSAVPFGWVRENGEDDGPIEGFSYGGYVWGVGKSRPAPHDDSGLFQIYSPHGSPDPWIEACKLITDQGRPALEIIVAASFAAPLMQFQGFDGVLVSGYSKETGIGKSSALDVGLAVWANPQKGKNGLDDTINSTFGKLGRLRALPVYWDEIQDPDHLKQAVKTLFKVTSGTDRQRLKSDLKMASRGSWNTMIVTCANQSLLDEIAKQNKSHTAGLARILEFEVPKVAENAKGQVELGPFSRAIHKLRQHHGCVGLTYAQFLGQNHERISHEVTARFDELRAELIAVKAERFWLVAANAILSGAAYANEIGVASFDVDGIKAFLVSTLKNMRSSVKGSIADMNNRDNIETIFTQFLNAMQTQHTITTNRMHKMAGKPPKGAIVVECDTTRLTALYVHMSKVDKFMRVSTTHLSKWLTQNDYPARPVMMALEKFFHALPVNARIGAGTSLAKGQERLYEFNMDSKDNAAYFEGFIS